MSCFSRADQRFPGRIHAFPLDCNKTTINLIDFNLFSTTTSCSTLPLPSLRSTGRAKRQACTLQRKNAIILSPFLSSAAQLKQRLAALPRFLSPVPCSAFAAYSTGLRRYRRAISFVVLQSLF